MRSVVACALVALVTISCGSEGERDAAAPSPEAAASAAAGAAGIAADEVLVTVQDTEITAGDLAAYEQGLPQSLRSQLPGAEGVRDLLHGLVDAELMVGEAEALGLPETPKVKRRLHKHYVVQLSALLLREEISLKVQVTEEQIREEYETNYWNREIWPAHILVATEEEAWEVVRKLREEGASFGEMAKQYSLADDAELGGDLRSYFRADDTATAVTTAVFGLPVGAVSDPIRTRDGWEINKVLDDREVPLSEVHDKIGRLLHRQEFFRVHGEYVQQLEGSYGVDYHGDGLDALIRAGGAGQIELPAADTARVLITYGTPVDTISAGRGSLVLRASGLPLSMIPDRDTAIRGLRQRLMADTLLVLEAESRGLQQRPEFAQEMAEYRRRLLIGELRRQEVIDPIEVTDADLEAQYEKSKDEFYRPFMADATEILVDTRAEADSLKARLAAGEDMKLLAAKHSQRPGAYHARGHLHLNADAKENLQPLVQATQDVEPGTVVGPVEVPEGFSLVRVSQRVAAGYRTMDEVRHILHYKIKMRRNYQGFEDYIRRLRERRADWVEWHDDAIEAVGQARSS